jgi:hypothetical protein
MKCGSLVCGKRLAGMARGTWRRTPRRFCGAKCKTDAWALKRAASLLGALSDHERRRVLRALLPEGEGEVDFSLLPLGEIKLEELPAGEIKLEEWPELPPIDWAELEE